MAHIHAYIGGTIGGTDGTLASEGTELTPISFTLDSTQEESKKQMVCLRCESGYKTVGNTTITATGTTASKWSFSATENGTYQSGMTITDEIGATNVGFWVAATSASGETSNDTSVDIVVTAKILPTE